MPLIPELFPSACISAPPEDLGDVLGMEMPADMPERLVGVECWEVGDELLKLPPTRPWAVCACVAVPTARFAAGVGGLLELSPRTCTCPASSQVP